MGSWFLDDWAFALELSLDETIDDDGFRSKKGSETPRCTSVFFGSKSTKECEQYPNQPEVAEFGERIDDPVSGLSPTETIEEFIDALVESIDRAEFMGWIEFVMGKMKTGVIGRQLLDGGVDHALGGQRVGLVGGRHGH